MTRVIVAVGNPHRGGRTTRAAAVVAERVASVSRRRVCT